MRNEKMKMDWAKIVYRFFAICTAYILDIEIRFAEGKFQTDVCTSVGRINEKNILYL